MAEIAAIVLAAGLSTRFAGGGTPEGASKVLALLEGRPLLAHVAETAAASAATPVIVVVGQDALSATDALAGLDVRIVHNARPAEGMAGSIQAGLRAVPETSDGVLILLADMPRVAPATLDALMAAFGRETPDAVVPVHDGRRGNPVLIARALFPALERLDGDEGARRILGDGSCRVLACAVEDAGILFDVDTREALAALERPF